MKLEDTFSENIQEVGWNQRPTINYHVNGLLSRIVACIRSLLPSIVSSACTCQLAIFSSNALSTRVGFQQLTAARAPSTHRFISIQLYITSIDYASRTAKMTLELAEILWCTQHKKFIFTRFYSQFHQPVTTAPQVTGLARTMHSFPDHCSGPIAIILVKPLQFGGIVDRLYVDFNCVIAVDIV